ncbi:MAG: hypothetical protein IJK67_02785 [Bacilli bacterium]|nr:hypothetical protein [Bacilli bacterium]
MTKLNINTDLLKSNVEISLKEVRSNLKELEKSALGISSPLVFSGSEKLVNISKMINNCVIGIDSTIEWYVNCSNNYDQFSEEAISDIDSLETYKFQSKNFNIKNKS